MQKIKYLDGLRGIASFIVVLNHFVVGFFPALYWGGSAPAHIGSKWEVPISGSVFNLLYNGNFAVCIFFVLSGFVLSQKFFQMKDIEIVISGAVKRYIRLVIPIFGSVMVAFLLMKLSLFYNQQAAVITESNWFSPFWTFNASFFGALKESFFDVFFKNSNTYNDALWTMAYEFFGSFLVFGFIAFFGRIKIRYMPYITAIVLLFQTYYLAFMLGILLSDLAAQNRNILRKLDKYKFLRLFILLAGLFLGSYPTGRTAEGTIYSFLGFIKPDWPYMFFHILGAFFVMIALLNSNRLQSFFSKKYFVFLGKISFAMYLIHLLIIGSFTSYIFIKLNSVMTYNYAFLTAFFLTIPVIFFLSYFFYLYIDNNAIKLGRFVYGKMFNDDIKEIK